MRVCDIDHFLRTIEKETQLVMDIIQCIALPSLSHLDSYGGKICPSIGIDCLVQGHKAQVQVMRLQVCFFALSFLILWKNFTPCCAYFTATVAPLPKGTMQCGSIAFNGPIFCLLWTATMATKPRIMKAEWH